MKKRLKIVLLCDQVHRELPALKLLRVQIQQLLGCQVFILGSLAEEQRILYLIYKIKPDIVFISQIQEGVTRRIAKYVKGSGAKLCVVPMEISYSKSNLYWLFNKRLTYNKYVDYYFVTGEQLMKDLKTYTDIEHYKLVLTGSPKIDLAKKENEFLDRRSFSKKHNIPIDKKNIFIFTTFFGGSEDYLKSDQAFKGNVKAALRIFKSIEETKKVYIKIIPSLCKGFSNFNIILKPHPLEDVSLYKKMDYKNLFLIEDEVFNNTLDSVDLVIHWNSTVATECWIQDKTTLQFAPLEEYRDLLSDFSGGNPIFKDYTILKEGIKRYMSKPLEKKYLNFQKQYLKRWYFKTDGKSSLRIAQYIQNISKGENKLRYKPINAVSAQVLEFLDRIFGTVVSRRIIQIFRRDYRWKYAAENYIFLK